MKRTAGTGALKNPGHHETIQDNPKHSAKPTPDFELGIFYLVVECYLLNGWQTGFITWNLVNEVATRRRFPTELLKQYRRSQFADDPEIGDKGYKNEKWLDRDDINED